MNAPSLPPDDDSPTIVLHTRVMDRRLLPPMQSAAQSGSFAPVAMTPSSSSPDATQPARRIRRESQIYRRLAISLGIALAFASGTVASFAVQVASQPAAAHDRQPRVAITRAAALRLIDGAGEKLEKAEAATSTVATTPATPRARSAKPGSAARPPSAPVPAAPEEPSSPSPPAADLLDKGLSGD